MKKSLFTLMLAVVAFASVQTVSAQDDRDARRQEMQKRMMERVEKDMKLDDSKKAKFEEIYGRYQNELMAVRSNRQGDQARERNQKKPQELTDAEATARLQEQFERQAEQIQQQQARLEIQKKYCAEFSSVLTPQQLVILYQPAQQGRGGNRQGGGRGGFGGGGRGGFGGPGPGAGGGFGGDF